MATTEQKRQIDNCLGQLSFLFAKIGIRDLTISNHPSQMNYDTESDINQILLGELCDFVDELHKTERIG